MKAKFVSIYIQILRNINYIKHFGYMHDFHFDEQGPVDVVLSCRLKQNFKNIIFNVLMK